MVVGESEGAGHIVILEHPDPVVLEDGGVVVWVCFNRIWGHGTKVLVNPRPRRVENPCPAGVSTDALASYGVDMTTSAMDVLDWRRRVAAMYRDVRADPDTAHAHHRWAEARFALLATHPASPVAAADRAAFAGGRVAPYDPAFRFVVPIDTRIEPERREVQTGTDGVVSFERIGTVNLGGLGSLDVWWLDSYGGGIFLPVHDATSGVTTYGAGRYLLDTTKGADLGGDASGLVVDLNFAYQPSCAYDEAWACPLPGRGNRLAAAVPVGEMYEERG